jgi:hypothetical protein
MFSARASCGSLAGAPASGCRSGAADSSASPQLIHARNGSLTADIVKALDTISAEHDINEPFDPGESVSLYLKDTNPPRDTRDAVSRCFRLRPDIPHFCA